MFDEALVDAFVAPTDEDQAVIRGEFTHKRVVEFFALWREEHDESWLIRQRLDVAESAVQYIDPHDHALAAAKRRVIDRAMLVERVLADVVDLQFEKAVFSCPFDDGDIERA